jgi:hypothetical protein
MFVIMDPTGMMLIVRHSGLSFVGVLMHTFDPLCVVK